MKTKVIVDTGPLVALLNRQDSAHDWVMLQMADIRPPMITCEAVLAEATYLTSRIKGAREALVEMIGENFLSIGLHVEDQHAALLAMLKRYVNVPMSLADACVVRLAELHPKSPVFTLDSDFNIYRKNGRQVIAQICP
ncbi:MAG: PIN domain-containing protein [Brachymonas sp.]|nr:PIN domain-containing protein [Brachymonas sp.]